MENSNVFITESDSYLFGNGRHYEIYEKMGAHRAVKDGKEGVYFAVWAPNAEVVTVVGDFNNWCGYGYEMNRLGDTGIYELFTENAKIGSAYKYHITSKNGEKHFKCDPYGNYAELRPSTASIVTDLNQFVWTDDKWIEKKTCPPPVLFKELVEEVLEPDMKPVIEELVQLKMQMTEAEKGKRIDKINHYIEENLSYYKRTIETMKDDRNADWKELNQLFYRQLLQ